MEAYKFSRLIHSFLVMRPQKIIIQASSNQELLENITKKLIKLTSSAEDQLSELTEVTEEQSALVAGGGSTTKS
jgi:hypothetical protein